MLTVHHLQLSQSERIVWLCEELGLNYDLKIYPREAARESFGPLHPLAAAPVITETSEDANAPPFVLAESGAIMEYLNHKYGNDKFSLPISHPNYTEYSYWFHFGNGTLQPAIAFAFVLTITGVDPNHPVSQSLKSKIPLALGYMNDRLSKVRWFAGDESFTLADIINVFSLTTMRTLASVDLTPYPAVLRWLQDIGSRPAYIAAMQKAEPGHDFAAALGPKAAQAFPDLAEKIEEMQKLNA